MVQWKGWRKALTVLAFTGPTLIGILIFSIYPILFNAYISFTNRNLYHPNPDCSITLTKILEPTCWSVFDKNRSTGMAEPFRIQDPLFANYIDLVGKFFTSVVLVAFLKIVACFIPLVVAGQVNKALGKRLERPVSAWVVTLLGILLGVAIGFLLRFDQAINLVTGSGDFFVVTFRTLLYVLLCIPLFFIMGLALALLLNIHDLPGRTFFRVILIVPWAASTVAIMIALVWQFFFREQGTINQITALFGIQSRAWLQDPVTAFMVIVVANVWMSYPFFMVTILGALQSIPGSI
jgi:arabinogalactan oligomer/maltooligosaccharide transport system permease protein